VSGSEGGGLAVAVAVPVPTRRLFTYRVPEELAGAARVGARVRVPFGGRRVVGTVVVRPADPPAPGIRLKEVEAVLDGPPVPPNVLELARFVADYYLCSWGDAIEAALPPDPGRRPVERLVRLAEGADPETLPARAVARRRLLSRLPPDGTTIPLGRLGAAGARIARELEKLGLVEFLTRPRNADRPVPTGPILAPPELRPTAAQAEALARILPAFDSPMFVPFLLYGATGSGKTEVYLRAAERTLRSGRSVLYLVPEIGLTPLLVGRLAGRFGEDLSVLHSGLTPRERHDSWDRIRRGESRFVLGTRSAVFAPLADPGLVVVDEEQDPSYKQEETPRYSGRDLAVVRAKASRAVLVLGSATPSLESYHHASTGRYTLLRLGGRVAHRPLAEVEVVDMRREFGETGEVRPLSRRLVEALRACVERGEQALVLRNRRGWAAALLCPACGLRVSCPRCSLSLTWHRSARRLRCHVCGIEAPRPRGCPACGAEELREMGEGTERIEAELRTSIPGARLARMDRDTVRRRGAHEALLRRFEKGELDILLGTQMIAKGHDFPRVTLVGVLSADQSLGLPDFRAAERTFQLLTQVAGRAGRGTAPGRVVVQAFDPGHPVLAEAAAQDYEAFYTREIRYRRALRYPPLAALVELVLADEDPLTAEGRARTVAAALEREGGGRILLSGPGPAPVERLKGLYRQQILVRSAGRRRLVEAVDRALESVQKQVPRRAVAVDVDPVSLM
jgi:primosomal protein N' (replication factor Y) (superfamily II helicase)